jgi:cell division protein FtsB
MVSISNIITTAALIASMVIYYKQYKEMSKQNETLKKQIKEMKKQTDSLQEQVRIMKVSLS